MGDKKKFLRGSALGSHGSVRLKGTGWSPVAVSLPAAASMMLFFSMVYENECEDKTDEGVEMGMGILC